MLPPAHRLTRSVEYQRTVRRGRRASCPTVVVHYAPSDGPGPGRVGFVVSKAVGNAVVRNRVKRRLRSAVRPCLGELRDMLVVVRANPAAAAADFDRLAGDLERCLTRVKDGSR